MSAPTSDRHTFPSGVSDGEVDCLAGGHPIGAGRTFYVVAEIPGKRFRACTGCTAAIERGALVHES